MACLTGARHTNEQPQKNHQAGVAPMALMCNYVGAKYDYSNYPSYSPLCQEVAYYLSNIAYFLGRHRQDKFFLEAQLNYSNRPTEKLRLGLLDVQCGTRETRKTANSLNWLMFVKLYIGYYPCRETKHWLATTMQDTIGENVAGNDGKTGVTPELLRTRLKGKGHYSFLVLSY